MPQPLKTLSLFPGKPEPPSELPAPAHRAEQIWIAVCVPELERDPPSDLRSLAIWSRTLTPTVSFAPPAALLLEVRSSLRLFGGLGSIKAALHAQAEQRRLMPRIGIAPTAKGALWLARHGDYEALTLTALRMHLRTLPMTVTGWPEATLMRLAEMGVDRLADVLRLPREGLARRLGSRYLRELDETLGRELELRAVWELPEKLSLAADLVPETVESKLLLATADQLLSRLTSDLRRRQRQIGSLEVRFLHLHGEPSVEVLTFLEPASDREHFLDLLAHRLERIRLRAPVIAIELATGDLLDMHLGHPDLFSEAKRGRFALSTEMIERLQERLGPKSVYGIALAADHRPESAWIKTSAGHEQESATWPASADGRPLWLLDTPRLLPAESGRPFFRGELSLEAGPERIEGGWWDQRDVSRDYFTATGGAGERLWIYFDHVAKRWYLHGIFG